MLAAGLPLMTTRSAFLPGAMEPMVDLLAQVGGAVEGADLDGFDGGEAVGVDEEFDFALVAEAGEGAAVAGGVEAGDEEAAGGYEFVLELGAVFVDEGAGWVGGRVSSELRV